MSDSDYRERRKPKRWGWWVILIVLILCGYFVDQARAQTVDVYCVSEEAAERLKAAIAQDVDTAHYVLLVLVFTEQCVVFDVNPT